MAKRQITRAVPEERHEDLIRATLRCLVKEGPAGTSVRAIAREADVSASLITYHFGGKQALIVDALKALSRDMRAAEAAVLEAAGDDPEERLYAFVRVGFEPPFLTDDYITARFLYWGLARTDPDVGAAHTEIYSRYRRQLGELLEPLLGADSDRDSVVFALSALLDGLWLEWCLDHERFDVGAMLEACRGLLRGALVTR
jgi:TetR/AcrR family transcriptional repressor of bet genes